MLSFTQQVAQWAAGKPADETYDYSDSDNCAICQFLRDSGYASEPTVSPGIWSDGEDGKPIGYLHTDTETSEDLAFGNEAPLENALIDHPRTFGALAARLSVTPA